MTKALILIEMSKGHHDNTKQSLKSSITQRFQTDLGRSDGATTVIQLAWLTGLRTRPSHFPQRPCNQKDTHLKFVNKSPYIDNKPTATSSGEVIKIDTHTALVINDIKIFIVTSE